MNATPTEIQFKLYDKSRIAAQRWGTTGGALRVIAIHGYLDNSSTYSHLAPYLVAGLPQLDLVAVDLSGHGKSTHRDSLSYFSYWIHEVILVADQLGWETFHLLGHSMGQAVVTVVSGMIPNRVQSSILIEGIGPNTTEPEFTPSRLVHLLDERQRFYRREPMVYPTFDAAVKRMMLAEAALSEKAVRTLATRGVEHVTGGLSFSHDPRLRAGSTLIITEAQTLQFLRNIAGPMLVVWGNHRWYPIDEEMIRKREQAVNNITVVRLEGNHHVHHERPEAVAPHMIEFYTKHFAETVLGDSTLKARL